ncbi:MAG: autotransporter outer membrane beta-barrel domain-containing protein [Sutterella sp.]|nr:autotransporter outer membrane beta-barrel domain-containing protein [Sutterella sp.]
MDILEGARLVVTLSPGVLALPVGTEFPGVITAWESVTGRFAGVPVVGNVPNIAYEAEDYADRDVEILYDPKRPVINLRLVENHERLPEPEPEPEPSPTPGPEGEGEPTTDPNANPTLEPIDPTPPVAPPVRVGETPLLSGTGKWALADWTQAVARIHAERAPILTEHGHALWAALLTTRGRLASTSVALGYSSETNGVAVGAETRSDRTHAGVLLAAAKTDLDERDASRKDTLNAHSWLLGLYGEHEVTERVTLDLKVAAGRSRLKGERQFVTEGLTAKSRTHASLYQAGVGLSWQATDLLKPFARLDYSRVTVKGFTESGANRTTSTSRVTR